MRRSLAIMVPVGWLTARAARLDAPGTRAVIFSGTTKNSLVVLTPALALPACPLELAAVAVTQLGGLGPAETAEASAVEHHRLAAGSTQSDDVGDDQDMVPAVELTLNRAVDPSHRTVNSGRSQRR